MWMGTLVIFYLDTCLAIFEHVSTLVHTLLQKNSVHTSGTFNPQKLHHYMLLFLCACSKQSGHVDDTSGTRQLNCQGRVCNNDDEIQCQWPYTHSALASCEKLKFCGYFLTYPLSFARFYLVICWERIKTTIKKH
jgi:hypothetical protein